jgi:hypothetical protein
VSATSDHKLSDVTNDASLGSSLDLTP